MPAAGRQVAPGSGGGAGSAGFPVAGRAAASTHIRCRSSSSPRSAPQARASRLTVSKSGGTAAPEQ
ncbi:hypothetical protein GCM10017581_055960 [Dactylosporangium matsuzakiense]|uniref:Uncharacterized protein n=1 Tax=Dactylosporangium matsuzakiense TaxID=53360 RepID=A0A9W6NND6_9ACTN|nr:hypothetical protein GCM10017581_055960 [Dactylosporangium matsuzakiense]